MRAITYSSQDLESTPIERVGSMAEHYFSTYTSLSAELVEFTLPDLNARRNTFIQQTEIVRGVPWLRT